MKFIAIAALFAATVLAVPTKDCATCDTHKWGSGGNGGDGGDGGNGGDGGSGNNGHNWNGGNGWNYPPTNGGGNPPSNGGNPPSNGGNPPSNGGNPPSNGGNPPSNGGNPPSNGGNPPSNGGNPPAMDPDFDACPSGLFSNAQCCDVDVLGLADLNCKTPSSSFSSAEGFEEVCTAQGQEPRCCVLPVLGQALLCQKVVGVA